MRTTVTTKGKEKKAKAALNMLVSFASGVGGDVMGEEERETEKEKERMKKSWLADNSGSH